MQNDVRKSRIRASFRARAWAASLCVGAQVFVTGAGIAAPLCLNAAWMPALAVLPASALAVFLCRRQLARAPGAHPSRVQRALLALVLLFCSILATSALVNLVEQTFLTQARAVYIVSATLLLFFFCALSTGTGASRLSFALRGLPLVLVAVLFFRAAQPGRIDGLFPLLGAGVETLMISALCMIGAAAPAAMLLLPPQEAENLQPGDVPGTWFFLWRVLLGVGGGVLILLALSLGNTYESIAAQHAWGERMRLVSASRPREGLLQAFLTLIELLLLALYAVNMLTSAEQAICQAFDRLKKYRLGLLLCMLLVAAALVLLVVWGFDAVLAIAAGWSLPAAAVWLWRGGKSEK